MDPLHAIRKSKFKKDTNNKKKFEFKLRINLWKALVAFFLILFFLPFILSVAQFGKTEGNVETSQALSDIKDGKVKEIVVQNDKLILTYEDGSIKSATKESTESFAELIEKFEVNDAVEETDS